MPQMAVDIVSSVCYVWGVLFAIIGLVAVIDELFFFKEE